MRVQLSLERGRPACTWQVVPGRESSGARRPWCRTPRLPCRARATSPGWAAVAAALAAAAAPQGAPAPPSRAKQRAGYAGAPLPCARADAAPVLRVHVDVPVPRQPQGPPSDRAIGYQLAGSNTAHQSMQPPMAPALSVPRRSRPERGHPQKAATSEARSGVCPAAAGVCRLWRVLAEAMQAGQARLSLPCELCSQPIGRSPALNR